MSLGEPNFRAELVAHYSAVRARLWTQPTRPVAIQAPHGQSASIEPELLSRPALGLIPTDPPRSIEETAARWRGIDERLFKGRVSPDAVIYVTAAYFKIDPTELIGPKRTRPLSRVRQAAMFIMRMLCHSSFLKTGGHFKRNHATALHTIHIARQKITEDPTFSAAVAEIVDLLVRTKA